MYAGLCSTKLFLEQQTGLTSHLSLPQPAELPPSLSWPRQNPGCSQRQEEAAAPLSRTNTRGRPSPTLDKVPPRTSSSFCSRCTMGDQPMDLVRDAGRPVSLVESYCPRTDKRLSPSTFKEGPSLLRRGRTGLDAGRRPTTVLSPSSHLCGGCCSLWGAECLGIRRADGKDQPLSTEDELLAATKAWAVCRGHN